MYRITFEGNALYIFEAENGLYTRQSEWDNPLVPEWADINGASNAASIVFDPLEKEEAFTPIIKHSLRATLIRENESQFTDIISGDDNKFFAVVLRGGALISDASGNPIITKTGTADARLLFYGSLINETYGEAFMPFSEVSLTFFDKIGELSDLSYYPTLPAVRVSDMLADLLHTIPTSKTLLIEWLYSFQAYGQTGDRVDQFYLNVSEWIGKKKLDVLKQLLLDTKLQLFIDYEVAYNVAYGADRMLFDSGAIRIRCVAKHTEPVGEYNVYRLTETVSNSTIVYSYTVQQGASIITQRTYSQFYFLWQESAAPPLVLPSIIIAFTHKGDRYYSVVNNGTTLNQTQLEAIGCVFPCVADQYSYIGGAIPLQNIGFPASMKRLFENNLGWQGFYIAGTFPYMFRSQIANVDEDITLTYANPLLITYTDITDYVENFAMVGYAFSEAKTRYVLGSTTNPIINRNANYNLARRAKHLTAELTYKISEDLIFPTTFELEYFESVNDQIYYNYGVLLKETSFNLLYAAIVNYFNGVPLNPSGTSTKAVGVQYNGDELALAALNTNTGNYAVAFNVISLIKSDGNFAIDVQAITDEYEASVETAGAIYLNLYAYYNGALYMYRADGAEWTTQILSNKPSILPTYTGDELSFQAEIPQLNVNNVPLANTPYKILAIIHFSQSLTAIDSNYFITSASIKLTNKPILPRKLTLKTILNDSMRKPVDFKSEFCTLPEIEGSIGYYRNGFMTESGHPVHTMYFRGLEQTLLAHASDQYGYNYSKERWNAKVDTIVDGVRMFNLFEFDFRVMMLTGGNYDVRRNILKGDFVEVSQLDRLDAWLWDDDYNLVWDDGSRILL
jgi:hypothetical protein